MCYTVYGDGDESRVCEDYLLVAAGCGVAVECGDQVCLDVFTDLGDLFEECHTYPVALFLFLRIGQSPGILAVIKG